MRQTLPPMNLKIFLLLLLVQGALAQSPTPDVPATSTLKEQDVIGTWLHVGTSDTMGGKQTEVAPVEIKWKFEAGGRGSLSQKISVSGDPWVSPLNWSLDGNAILLAGGRTRYTVVRPGSDSMIWKNEDRGNYYHVRRLP